jgi:hypothetical protein
MFEFVFAAAIREDEVVGATHWTTTRNAALSDRDMAYVDRVKPTFAHDPVWTITARGEADDIISPDHEVRL